MEISLVIISLLVILIFSIAFVFLRKPIYKSAVIDISQDDFINRQHTTNDFILLDVRARKEFDQGHITGSINISHTEIPNRLVDIPNGKDIIIYCRSGKRAMIAANLLSKHDYRHVYHLHGDILLWVENNHPLNHEK